MLMPINSFAVSVCLTQIEVYAKTYLLDIIVLYVWHSLCIYMGMMTQTKREAKMDYAGRTILRTRYLEIDLMVDASGCWYIRVGKGSEWNYYGETRPDDRTIDMYRELYR